MKRVPIQFYVSAEEKERAQRVTNHFGGLTALARKGFIKELERAERLEAEEAAEQEKEQKAS